MNKVESLHASEVIVAVILAKHEFSLLKYIVQSNNCEKIVQLAVLYREMPNML